MLKILRRFACVFLLLFSATTVFAQSIDLVALFKEYENDLKPISMAIAGAYLNKPKIELDGVHITKGDSIIPKRIEFNNSDASSYLYALNNPRSNGFFGFFSTLTSAFSPLISKAQDLLIQRDFNEGEVVINGWIELSGGENLDLMSLLIESDFSSLDLKGSGEIAISGARCIDVSFSGNIVSDDYNDIEVIFNDLCLNGNAIKTGPIMISFLK